MLIKLWNVFKLQILISITLAIVIISSNIIKTPVVIFQTALGALLGTFVLDMDYFIYAYITDPDKDFSKSLRAYVRHYDFKNLVNHIYYNKHDIQEKTLNNILFQIGLAIASLIVASSVGSYFIKALIFSTFGNSIYKVVISHLEGKAKEWFWALKETPGSGGIYLYAAVMIIVLISSISFF